MKKIIMAVAAIAMAASMFAVDVAAKVTIEGNVASGDKDSFNVIGLNDTNFKDSKEILSFNVSGDKAGASFKIGTDDKLSVWGFKQESWETWDGWMDGKTSSSMTTNPGGTLGDLNIRSLSIWLKPIDMLKITLGSLGDEKTYCEHINWWCTPYSRGSFNAFPGVSVELTPIDGLRVVASLKTGWGGYFANKGGYQDWSLLAKYNFGTFDIGAGIHDEGKDAGKIIQVGGSYGNEWGGQFYGFLNIYVMSDKNFEFNKMAIDNWFKFAPGAFTASVRVPVGFSFDGNILDLDWEAKIEVPLSGFNFYTVLGSANALDRPVGVNWGQGAYTYYNLKDFHFTMSVKPGITFSVGAAAMDFAFRLDLAEAGDMMVKWAVPFSAVIAF